MMNKNLHPKLHSTINTYESIIFVGGGTGWHIQPIVSLIKRYKKEENILWIGGRNSNEQKTAKENTTNFKSIPTLKLSTTKSPKILLYPLIILVGIFASIRILHRVKKENKNLCVFSKWGPGSLSVGIAAWILRIPLYIHESDSIPGRANQLLGRFATRIFVGFESTKKYFPHTNISVVWQILDEVFYEEKSIRKNPWKTDKPHLIVLCGSQWARSIFLELLKHIKKITEKYEVCIILGKLNENMQKDFESQEITKDTLHIFPWIWQEVLIDWIAHSNLAITRGSATSLAELDTFGVKKIIVPLPSAAKNHQYHNAKNYEKKWDIVLEQKNIEKLTEKLKV